MKIACIVGARPNFVKIAPIMQQLKRYPDLFEAVLVHTGQHYDDQLSSIFFKQLDIQLPDFNLEVGSGPVAQQTGAIMQRFDDLCVQERFDRVLVVGDVTSTLGCSIVAAKRQIPVDHVEAGLRSFDRSMPEEINRLVTDSLSDLFFVSEPSGVRNLLREGHPKEKIHFVGNVMIDSLCLHIKAAVALQPWKRFALAKKDYAVVTLHRPSNVDDPYRLHRLVDLLKEISDRLPIIFPVHPRTKAKLGSLECGRQVRLSEPLGYWEFLGLLAGARVVVTDSGGVQEETTSLGVPCLTLRANTERPVTVRTGTNTLVGDGSLEKVPQLISEISDGKYKKGGQPELWDGRAGHRIVSVLSKIARANLRATEV